ncbi:hypothetical protein [Methylobacterium brachythecii]|uniref:Uncharacterized protein n=1 Tax=Methylobacterium brachythecii TaxID=1176177 RepID=A0A7W6APP3_9HYPH|nr:hypothetical protein [Methylobacterium brachythecii]MBB3905679.1 hypothetical protein [Methylobacterium brachythecii]GLS46943.1 hypothetical protein GCM10007884_49430 [Methylobacterium brachythecii]
MEATTLAKLQTLRTEANSLRDAFDAFAHRLDALITEQTPKDAPPASSDDWKRDDGRLNDQGVAAMEAMFEAGRTVTEIAKEFDITVSAASHRKRIWQAKPAAAR